jgi:hypothetical protein
MQKQAPKGEDLWVYYPNDPDLEKAGQGLVMAPFVRPFLGADRLLFWMMSPAEQAAFIFLLSHLRPQVAVEIGTFWGGSLQVLSRFCGRVYSLDSDPDVPRRLAGRFPNVEYIVGPSRQTLPPLLERLARDGEELSFVLVDADHSAEGVRADLENLLRYRPVTPLFIVMHDSFNPECRRGLRTTNWAASPFVHAVELDFVPGTVTACPSFAGQLWGGLALAYLKPQERQGYFEVTARGECTFQAALAAASHWPRPAARGDPAGGSGASRPEPACPP